MNILITGASGFIGMNLIDSLKNTKHKFFCISRKKNEDSKNITWIKANLENTNFSFLKNINIDFVFFLAGQTSVYEAKIYPEKNFKINTLSLIRLIDFLNKNHQKPFILYTSTTSVYGLNNLTNNLNTVNPITLYDVSKYSAELSLNEFIRQKKIQGCIFRLSNIIGKNTSRQKKDRGIIGKIIHKIKNNESIEIWGNGNFSRDYLYIKDLINLFIITLSKYKKMNGHTFDVGSGKSILLKTAFSKVFNETKKYFNSTSVLKYIPFPKDAELIEKRSTFTNINKLKKLTGWEIKFNFNDSVKDIIESENK
jgi:UDP-glucose 4-epimerase